MKFFTYTVVLLSFHFTSFAQRDCGTREYTRKYFRNSPLEYFIAGPARDTIANEVIYIPIVVHLLYKTNEQNISNEQIISQIEALNNDFGKLNEDGVNNPSAFKGLAADARIKFCLARIDPAGRPTSGIIHKRTSNDIFLGDDGMKFSSAGGDDAWDSKQYLNIWVCNLFGRSLGYATIPGGVADLDGVVIKQDVFGTIGALRHPFNKGRTATHEIGHWLGLKHIWGDDDCGSDDVDDTPRQRGYNYNCPSFPHLSTCSPNGYGDLFMNFMDFTDDACMNLFTHGQKNKMRGTFALNGYRNSFLNSTACDSSLAIGAPLPEVILPTEIDDVISVFPNPVMNILNIRSTGDISLASMPAEIFTVTGKKISHYMLASNTSSINIGYLPAGLYILKIGEGKESKMIKLVKL